MSVRRIFGVLLGIVGIIYAVVLFDSPNSGAQDVKALASYGVLGLIFFISGISLARTPTDDSIR